jgi:Tfp pilus assembly protein PilF
MSARQGLWSTALLMLVACGPKQAPEPAAVDATPAAGPAAALGKAVNADALNEEAAVLMATGNADDLQSALAKLNLAVNADAAHMGARLNLGIAVQRMGDLAAARGHYEAVASADPSSARAWLLLGAVEEAQGNLTSAAERFRQGLSQAPEDTSLHAAMIGVLRKQKKYDEAIAASRAALAINANDIAIYNNFGLVYLDQGNFTLARFIFQKALQAIPDADKNAYIHCNLGWVAYQDGDPYTATTELKTAVELDPKLVPALVYLSRIYMDDRNYGDTVPLLERAAELEPKNADVQLTLGVAYRGVGRLPEAEAAYRKALQLNPSDPAPHFNLGVLLGDFKKDYDGAVAAFNTYVQAGGEKSSLATEYITEIEKEKKRAAKRREALEEKAKKDEERKAKEKLLEEADKGQGDTPPANEPAPDAPSPEAPVPAPAEGGG